MFVVLCILRSLVVLEKRHERTLLSSSSIFESQLVLPAERKTQLCVCN